MPRDFYVTPIWKQVTDAAKNGNLSVAEVARKLGISKASVYAGRTTAAKHGVKVIFAKDESSPRQRMIRQVLKLSDGTRTFPQISETLGISRNTVSKYISILRKMGHKPKVLLIRKERGSRPIASAQDRGEVQMGGGFTKMISDLQPEVQRWLLGLIPEGSTVGEVVKAIIIDAYHEEQDAQNPDPDRTRNASAVRMPGASLTV